MTYRDFGLPDGVGFGFDAYRQWVDEAVRATAGSAAGKVVSRVNLGTGALMASIDVAAAYKGGTPRDVKIQAVGAVGAVADGAAGAAGGAGLGGFGAIGTTALGALVGETLAEDIADATLPYDPTYRSPTVKIQVGGAAGRKTYWQTVPNPIYDPIDDARRNGPQIGGTDPAHLAETIRTAKQPGGPSFLRSRRDSQDNPYGPNGTPQVGGVDPQKLAASVVRAIVNSPDYKPQTAPDSFEDRGGPTGPNSRPPDSHTSTRNGHDYGGINGNDERHYGGRSDRPGVQGAVGGNGAGNPANDPRNGGNPTTNPVTPSKPAANYASEAKEKGKSGQQPTDSKAGNTPMPEHKSKDEHNHHLENSNRDRSNPIILDLNGNGVEITELSTSNQFRDAAGDGLLHRTAWAASGDGVLFYDVGNDGLITEKREYVFTEWDPTATSDLKALRAAFDTNGDGKLTVADAAFAQFKVMVTNPDGSTTAKTLAELGITEINLDGDATEILLPDGSKITAQTTYTKNYADTSNFGDTSPIDVRRANRLLRGMLTGLPATAEAAAFRAAGAGTLGHWGDSFGAA